MTGWVIIIRVQTSSAYRKNQIWIRSVGWRESPVHWSSRLIGSARSSFKSVTRLSKGCARVGFIGPISTRWYRAKMVTLCVKLGANSEVLKEQSVSTEWSFQSKRSHTQRSIAGRCNNDSVWKRKWYPTLEHSEEETMKNNNQNKNPSLFLESGHCYPSCKHWI